MQAHTVYLIIKVGLVKYVSFRPVLHGQLAKWAVILEQCDLSMYLIIPSKGKH